MNSFRRSPLLAGVSPALQRRFTANTCRWLDIHHDDEPDLILSSRDGEGDVRAIRDALGRLRGQGGGTSWQLSSDRKGLQRQFTFKTFKAAWVSDIYIYL